MKRFGALLFCLTEVACAGTQAVDAGPIDATPADSGIATDSGNAADSGSSQDAEPSADAEPADSGAVTTCPQVSGEVVHFMTDDGVTLEGDLYTQGATDRPLLVLLHMIPPNNTRSNYPASFINALLAAGSADQRVNVINLDRRGAGGSGGVARDAYMGPKGALDVKAAVEFFKGHACGVGLSRLALVGASNGSASVLDYTVLTETDAALLRPSTILFLTGGTYTEAQNRIANHRATLDPLRIDFVYSTAERAWSAQFLADVAHGWGHFEYANGAHGTGMFAAEPSSIAAVAGELVQSVNR